MLTELQRRMAELRALGLYRDPPSPSRAAEPLAGEGAPGPPARPVFGATLPPGLPLPPLGTPPSSQVFGALGHMPPKRPIFGQLGVMPELPPQRAAPPWLGPAPGSWAVRAGPSMGDPRRTQPLDPAELMQPVSARAGARPYAAASPFGSAPQSVRGSVPESRPTMEAEPGDPFQLAQSGQAAADAFKGQGPSPLDKLPRELRPPFGAVKPSETSPPGRLTRSPDPRATRKEVAIQALGENLVLGKNESYRDMVLEGAYLSGVSPQFLAATANVEASKRSDGVWDPRSDAPDTSAQGMMQFTVPTWLDEARRKGTFLNQVARERGLIGSDGLVDKSRERELLNLRNDPQLSLITAGQMAKQRVAELRKAGLLPRDLTEAEEAKFAYLAHHDGVEGAMALMQGNLSLVTDKMFRDNVPDELQGQYLAAHGDEKRAYQAYMYDFIDKEIDFRLYTKGGQGPAPRSMRDMAKAGGQAASRW